MWNFLQQDKCRDMRCFLVTLIYAKAQNPSWLLWSIPSCKMEYFTSNKKNYKKRKVWCRSMILSEKGTDVLLSLAAWYSLYSTQLFIMSLKFTTGAWPGSLKYHQFWKEILNMMSVAWRSLCFLWCRNCLSSGQNSSHLESRQIVLVLFFISQNGNGLIFACRIFFFIHHIVYVFQLLWFRTQMWMCTLWQYRGTRCLLSGCLSSFSHKGDVKQAFFTCSQIRTCHNDFLALDISSKSPRRGSRVAQR